MEPLILFEPRVTLTVKTCESCHSRISEGGAYYTFRGFDNDGVEVVTETICIFCRSFGEHYHD